MELTSSKLLPLKEISLFEGSIELTTILPAIVTLLIVASEQSMEPLVGFKIRFPDASIILFSKERYDMYYYIILYNKDNIIRQIKT